MSPARLPPLSTGNGGRGRSSAPSSYRRKLGLAPASNVLLCLCLRSDWSAFPFSTVQAIAKSRLPIMVDSPSQPLRQIAKLRKCERGRNQSGAFVLTDEQATEENSTAAEEFNQQQPKASRVFGALTNAKEARGSLPTRPPVERLSADSPTEASPVSSEIASAAPVADSNDETALDAAPKVQAGLENVGFCAEEDRKGKMEWLRGVTLFEGLTDDELVHVADVAKTVRHPAGTRLIQKSVTCGIFYMVMEGAVECGSNLMFTSGESFGERALLEDYIFEANATTKSDVALLALHREDVVRVLGPLCKVLDNKFEIPMISYLQIILKSPRKEQLIAQVGFATMEIQVLEEIKKKKDELLEERKKRVEELKEFNLHLLKVNHELKDANAALEKEHAALKKEHAAVKKNMCPLLPKNYYLNRGSCKGRRAPADKPNGN